MQTSVPNERIPWVRLSNETVYTHAYMEMEQLPYPPWKHYWKGPDRKEQMLYDSILINSWKTGKVKGDTQVGTLWSLLCLQSRSRCSPSWAAIQASHQYGGWHPARESSTWEHLGLMFSKNKLNSHQGRPVTSNLISTRTKQALNAGMPTESEHALVKNTCWCTSVLKLRFLVDHRAWPGLRNQHWHTVNGWNQDFPWISYIFHGFLLWDPIQESHLSLDASWFFVPSADGRGWQVCLDIPLPGSIG